RGSRLAGIVDQDVDVPKSGIRLPDCMVHLLAVRNIGDHMSDLTRCAKMFLCLAQRVGGASQQRDPCAPLQQRACNRGSYAACAAGYQRMLAVQWCHYFPAFFIEEAWASCCGRSA